MLFFAKIINNSIWHLEQISSEEEGLKKILKEANQIKMGWEEKGLTKTERKDIKNNLSFEYVNAVGQTIVFELVDSI